jgi:hypothetical protein
MRLNGWERIWLVLTVLFVLWMLTKGWGEFAGSQNFRDDVHSKTLEQMRNPACSRYAIEPWSPNWEKLPYEPCGTLISARRYFREPGQITPESVTAKHERERSETLREILLWYAGFAIALSFVAYVLAWLCVKIFQWVRAGFSRQ